ncbi:hypothetical protein ACFLQN_03285 [Candidatus Aenigmatarchaeota archaeon]
MKGIATTVSFILLLLVAITLSGSLFGFVNQISYQPQQVLEEQSIETEERLGRCLRVDNIDDNEIYIRNCGDEVFEDDVRVYVNEEVSCISTGSDYGNDANLDVAPNEIKKVNVGCCIPEGNSPIKIASNKWFPMEDEIEDFDVAQLEFFGWETSNDYMKGECIMGHSWNCFPDGQSGYPDYDVLVGNACELTPDNLLGVTQQLINESTNQTENGTFYPSEPPWTWAMRPVWCDRSRQHNSGPPQTGDCGQCLLRVAKVKFYYNPGSFPGGEVWLVGNSDQCIWTEGEETLHGIEINDNMYMLLNGNFLLFGGVAYSEHRLWEAEEYRCINPIELSSTGFLEDCAENNITMIFEDYRGDGYVEDFYFQGI